MNPACLTSDWPSLWQWCRRRRGELSWQKQVYPGHHGKMQSWMRALESTAVDCEGWPGCFLHTWGEPWARSFPWVSCFLGCPQQSSGHQREAFATLQLTASLSYARLLCTTSYNVFDIQFRFLFILRLWSGQYIFKQIFQTNCDCFRGYFSKYMKTWWFSTEHHKCMLQAQISHHVSTHSMEL